MSLINEQLRAPTVRKGLPQEVTTMYISIMLLVFPLFTGLQGYSSITFSKYLFFVLTACIYLAAVIPSAIISKQPPTINKGSLFALLFAVTMVVSTLLSPHREAAVIGASRYDGMVTQLLYAAVFIAITSYGCYRKEFILLLAVSSGLCSLSALLQLMNINVLWLFPDGYGFYDGNISYTGTFLGTMGNTDVYSAFCCISIPLIFLFPIHYRNKKAYILNISLLLTVFSFCKADNDGGRVALMAALAAGILIYCSRCDMLDAFLHQLAVVSFAAALSRLICFSREGFSLSAGSSFITAMVLTAVITAAYVMVRNKKPHYSRRSFVIWAVSIAAASSAAALMAVRSVDFNASFLHELHEVLNGRVDDSFGSSRIMIWRQCLELFPEHPLFGGGPDTLVTRLDIKFSRYVSETVGTISTFVDNAHNEYIGLLINTGISGLFSYLGMIFCSIFKGIKSKYGSMLTIAVISAMVQSMFGIGLCFTVPFFIIFTALLNSANQQGDEK